MAMIDVLGLGDAVERMFLMQSCGGCIVVAARMMHLEGWFGSWVPDSVYCAGVVGARLRPGTLLLWILRSFCFPHVHVFVADTIKSFDTVDRGISDRVFSGLGLLA